MCGGVVQYESGDFSASVSVDTLAGAPGIGPLDVQIAPINRLRIVFEYCIV